MTFIVLLPLLVVLVALLFKRHMMEAGFLGALTAMLIGGIGIPKAADVISKAIPGMLSITVPILYSATALAVAKAGGFASLLKLVRRAVGKHLWLVAGAIVLIQALATYAAGLGAGNTMVTGPLALAAVGAVPELIAGMAIATAASFETSPSSAESAVASKLAGIPVADYAETMRPYAVLFWMIGIGLAMWGVYRRGRMLKEDTDTHESDAPETVAELWRASVPTLYFVVVVVAGKYLNDLVGWHLFTPVFNVISTLALVGALNKQHLSHLGEYLVNGSSFILTRLFAIGLFLGFINIIGEIGTFKYIAELASRAPHSLVVAAAALAGFLVAVPSGAYSVGVISLVVPAMAAVGLTPLQIGLVCIAIGLGTQVSLVQINVAALSQTFEMSVEAVVKNNFRYVPFALAVVIAIGLVL